MSTRIQQAQLVTSPAFLQQLQGSLYSAAAAVLNEGPVANHANRLAWARAIFANAATQAAFCAPGFLTNATIAGEAGNAVGASGTPVLDSDVDFVVSSLFNTFANYYANAQPPGTGGGPGLGS